MASVGGPPSGVGEPTRRRPAGPFTILPTSESPEAAMIDRAAARWGSRAAGARTGPASASAEGDCFGVGGSGRHRRRVGSEKRESIDIRVVARLNQFCVCGRRGGGLTRSSGSGRARWRRRFWPSRSHRKTRRIGERLDAGATSITMVMESCSLRTCGGFPGFTSSILRARTSPRDPIRSTVELEPQRFDSLRGSTSEVRSQRSNLRGSV